MLNVKNSKNENNDTQTTYITQYLANTITTTITCQWRLANKMTYIQFGLADNANGRNNTIS